MIIGITGTLGSGKDSVADYLKNQGFAHYSLSDEIRAVLRDRGEPLTLENLIRVGNELRATHGADYLAQAILRRVQRLAVISSIRHPDELAALRETGRFFLCSIDAPIELRYQRIRTRQRPGEDQTLLEFREVENRQLQGIGPNQRLQEIIDAADYYLTNDRDRAHLHEQIGAMLADIRRRSQGSKKSSQDQMRLL